MQINSHALIVGAMKCGTSSLFSYLSQHPEIAPCSLKEPHFFSKPDHFGKGYDYYQSLWNWHPQQHKIALEATPGYTKITDQVNTAENIALVQTEQKVSFKFIYIMRHPLERIESHYIHEAAKLNRQSNYLVSQIEQKIIDTSKYALQIAEFYQRFPAENILLLDFEELKHNPNQLLKQVCQFLEIDAEFEFEQTKVAHNNRQRLRIGIPGWRKIRKTALLKYLNRNISEQQKKNLKALLGRKRNITFQLDPQLEQKILDELKPDLLELRSKYHFDFQSWQLNL